MLHINVSLLEVRCETSLPYNYIVILALRLLKKSSSCPHGGSSSLIRGLLTYTLDI